MAQPEESTTFLAELLPEKLSERLGARFTRLCLEAMFLMAFSLLFPFILGISQGAMLALFMVSVSLGGRANQLMTENRENIWEKQLGGWVANRISAVSILGLFLGLFVATLTFAWALAMWASEKEFQSFFAFLIKVEHLQLHQPLSERFSSFGGILFNNAMVLLTTLFLGLLYRIYGMILVLSWNACLWAVVILYVFRQAWLATKISTLSFVSLSIVGMLPHLLLEASAYILAALAAVFLSRAFTKYTLSDDRFKRVGKASLTLLAASIVALLLAALTETFLPPLLLASH